MKLTSKAVYGGMNQRQVATSRAGGLNNGNAMGNRTMGEQGGHSRAWRHSQAGTAGSGTRNPSFRFSWKEKPLGSFMSRRTFESKNEERQYLLREVSVFVVPEMLVMRMASRRASHSHALFHCLYAQYAAIFRCIDTNGDAEVIIAFFVWVSGICPCITCSISMQLFRGVECCLLDARAQRLRCAGIANCTLSSSV